MFNLRNAVAEECEEQSKLLQDEPPANTVVVPKLYKARWYILFIFSLSTVWQACAWNTFGPIAASAKHVFQWDNATISMLANWGAISLAATCLFSNWLMDVKGNYYKLKSVPFLFLEHFYSVACKNNETVYR